MAEQPEANPYVGPRPFELGETGLFFGREREQRELLSLVVAHRVVLLYAASGAGKTSLLNAALVPALEEEGFEVLPPARVRALSADEEVPTESNVYVFGLLTHISEGDGADVGDATIAAFLGRREHAVGPDGYPAPRALIVDQLEELLTLHQGRWPEREGFFRQLAEAVEADPLLRIVLAIREDYLAQLDPYARLLPDRLRARIRLERLGAEAALKAATAPASRAGRSFAPGVAENLVGDLLQARVAGASGETVGVEGEYVEPVHLQVTCRTLWSGLPPDANEITEEHRLVFADVDQVLSQFYEETIASAASRAGMEADRLRERFEEAFITPLDTRGTVYWTPSATAGMPDDAVKEMDTRHLIRAEHRAGARWYELTHDRLIGPVRASNRKRRAERASRRRRRQLRAGAGALGVGLASLVAAGLLVLNTSEASQSSGLSADEQRLEERIEKHATELSALARTLPTGAGAIRAASFTSDGSRVLTLGGDREVQIWDPFAGERLGVLIPFPGGVDVAEFDPKQQTPGRAPRLLVASSGSAAVLSTGGSALVTLPTKRGLLVVAARFTKQGPVAVTVDDLGRAEVWRGGRVAALGDPNDVLPGEVAADVSADGRFAIIDTGSRVDVWRTSTRSRAAELRTPGQREPSAILSPDGNLVATPSSDGRVSVWDWDDRTVIGRLPRTGQPVGALTFSPDGKRLAVADGRDVRVLDLDNDKVTELGGHTGDVNEIALSPDRRIAATASDDGTAQLWSLVSGTSKSTLAGNQGRVMTVLFSPDGRAVFTGGSDGTALVWASVPDLKLAMRIDEALHTVRVSVSNIGSADAAATSAVLRAGGKVERNAVPAVASDRAVKLSFPLPRSTRAGARIEVEVDPDHRVRESSETNNVLTVAVPRVGTEPSPGQLAAQRRRAIVKAALAGVRKQAQVHYTAGPERMDGVRRKVRLPDVPRFEDTSSFVTWCYFQARLPDPSRRGYDGSGYSGTLVTHGRPVKRSELRPGDLVFYGQGQRAIRYVGIFVGNGNVVAHRSEQGPRLQRLEPPSGDPFAYRSYLP